MTLLSFQSRDRNLKQGESDTPIAEIVPTGLVTEDKSARAATDLMSILHDFTTSTIKIRDFKKMQMHDLKPRRYSGNHEVFFCIIFVK